MRETEIILLIMMTDKTVLFDELDKFLVNMRFFCLCIIMILLFMPHKRLKSNRQTNKTRLEEEQSSICFVLKLVQSNLLV